METPTTFGARVAALRLLATSADGNAAISCSELDRLAQLHRGHTWQIEQGKAENPKADTVRALATVTGCTVGWLLAGEGDAPTADEVREAVARARNASTSPVAEAG
jgi:transcriptional regulator with XRE-family HTH domain